MHQLEAVIRDHVYFILCVMFYMYILATDKYVIK